MSSPNDLVSAYRAALARLETARRDLRTVASVVTNVALVLLEWSRIADDKTAPWTAAAWEKGCATLDGADWPSADRLAEVVAAFQAARAAVEVARDALPQDRRAEVESLSM